MAHGSLTLNADGSFSYQPAALFVGNDSFTYTANDGTADSNTATVTITVNSVLTNTAPVANDDSYDVNQDTLLSIIAPGVLADDTDADGDTLTAVLDFDVAHGSLTLNSDGSFSYQPTAGYSGPDSFTYTANDGTADSNTATVTITVNSVFTNTAPVASDDSGAMNKNVAINVPAPGYRGRHRRRRGRPHRSAGDRRRSRSLTLNADGSFSYTPTANYVGADSFTYTAFDGTANSNPATVNLTISEPGGGGGGGGCSIASEPESLIIVC